MKVLVTGGGGFLGTGIVRRLLARGDDVTVLGRRNYVHLGDDVTQVLADIRDKEIVQETTKDHDVVFHVASVPGIWGPAKMFNSINIDPLERIARLTYRKWTDVNEVSADHDIETASFVGAFLKAAVDYRADGLLCHPLMSCRPATYTLLITKNILEEHVKVPGVVVEGDIVDLRVFNEAEALSKLEAFVETMDHYREVRRKEGMSW